MTKDEALMQMLNEINAGLKTALTRVNELVAENKALKEALAQPEQEPYELTIAYMSGLYDGKKKRPWVGLTDEEIDACWNNLFGPGNYNRRNVYQAIEAALRSKNT